ncbi:MAG: patatin-like phospholipase family protein [Chlamydiota bacterium]
MFRRFIASFFVLMSCCLSATALDQATTVLALDGGGVRGVVTLEMLVRLQQATGLNPNRDIGVYAGTSTGSIIAVLLAGGIDLEQLLQDYKEMSEDVFSNPRDPHLILPKYSHERLRKSLSSLLSSIGYSEDSCLGDLPKKVVIPTTRLCDPKKKRWAAEVMENFTEEGKQIKIIDALLRSTAAPTFFPSYQGCVDGGIGMKDPSLAAVCDVLDFAALDVSKITVLSMGTGYTEKAIEHDVDWGKGEWAPKLLPLMGDVTDQIPEALNQKLLGNSFIKLDFVLPQSVALDDYTQINDLIAMTDDFIANHHQTWDDWCQWVQSQIVKSSSLDESLPQLAGK